MTRPLAILRSIVPVAMVALFVSVSYADTLLRLSSDSGDPVGQGLGHLFTGSDGTFSVVNGSRGEVRVVFTGTGAGWTLNFAPPPNATLACGLYENAMRFASQEPNTPGLSVTGTGAPGCNKITGRFEVRQLARSGSSITAFWATFEQHCNGVTPALRGEVRWNADTSLYVTSPALVFTYPTRTVQVAVTSVSADSRPIQIVCPSLPSGASFFDHGDGTGELSWPSGSATPASFAVPFVATDDMSHVATTTTTLHVFWPDVFRFTAPNSNYVFTPPNRPFDLRLLNGTQVAMTYATAGHTWTWRFDRPFTPKFEPGVFQFARKPLLDVYPYLETVFDQNGCSSSAGTFHLRRVTYGTDGQPVSFWATFDQLCNTSHQVGEIRINADTSLYVTAPATLFATPNQAVSFDLDATDAAVRPVSIQTAGLPAGAQVVATGPASWHFDWPAGGSTVGDRIVRFAVSDDQGATANATTTIRVHAPNFIRLQSEPGDPVGLGASVQYTPAQGVFLLSPLGPSLQLAFQGAGHWWTSNFAAPSPRALAPGIYDECDRYDFQDADQAGFEVLGDDRRCSELSGAFQIRRITYSGSTPTSYWATFEQRCDGAPGSMRGEMRFNADTSLYVGSLADVSALSGVPLEIGVAGTDTRGLPLELSAPDSPAGTAFSDHGDGTGSLTWLDPPLGDQDVAIRFLARSSPSDTAISNTIVHIGQPPLLAVTSLPGDPIGLGQSGTFGPDSGAFAGVMNADSSVTLTFVGSGHSYSLTFGMAGGHLPRPGRYDAAYVRDTPPVGPWFDIQADGRACSSMWGTFRIRELRITADGTLAGCWATFSQRCQSQPAFAGEIRYASLEGPPTSVEVPHAMRTVMRVRGSNPTTWPFEVEFSLAEGNSAMLQLVDVAGRVRFSHALDELSAGSHRFAFTRTESLASGVYFVRLIAGSERLISRVVLLR